MDLRIFDVPDLFDNTTKAGIDFIEALASLDIDELAMFGHDSVQKILNYHWKEVRKYMYFCHLAPIVAQMFVFSFWHIMLIPQMN